MSMYLGDEAVTPEDVRRKRDVIKWLGCLLPRIGQVRGIYLYTNSKKVSGGVDGPISGNYKNSYLARLFNMFGLGYRRPHTV